MSLQTLTKAVQTRHSPIIVGDRYELAEVLGHTGGNDGGLLAKADYQTALLSMSGYGKHVASDMNDDESRKSHIYTSLADYSAQTQDGSYYAYAPIAFSESQVTMSSANFDDTSNHSLHDSQSAFQHREMYDTHSDLTEYGIRKALVVESFSPTRGNPGTQVNIYLRSDYDLLADPILVFTLSFGSHRVSATLSRLETSGPYHEFAASAIAPDMSETSSANSTLQLRLQIYEQSGQDAGNVEIGYFEYVSNVLGSSPPLEGTRKRKLSEASMSSSIQNIEDPSFAALVTAQNTQIVDTANSISSRYAPYGRAQNKFRDITARSGTQDLSISSTGRPFMRPPHSSSAFSPSYSFGNSAGRSAALDGASASSAPLQRTSTLQQSPGASPAASMGGSTFNPYPLYGQKAVLKLKGNLNSMTDNWTPEEWAAKRRLVQFFRSRDGCTVNARFAPVKPEDHQNNSITISCIWWEERQECFATSVDTIALLEQLVDNRFTVEEKNRIRRNLEGFKPLTVAKGKADSEEFFKVIMGFPKPKPRNIEKDVKVFEWKILAGALKKIMSKYSASHSSTITPLSAPPSSLYTPYDPSHTHPHISSRSASISTASSHTYAQTLKSSTLPSPNDTLPSQYSDAVTGAKPLHTTNLTHNYIPPTTSSQYQTHPSFMDPVAVAPRLPSSTNQAYPLERSRSYHDLPDYTPDPSMTQRYLKRPRASTSSSYSHHQQPHTPTTALAYAHQQQHRSFSEQPSSHQHQRSGSFSQLLPSLSEEYATASSGTPTPTAMLHQPQPVKGGGAAVLRAGVGERVRGFGY